MDPDSIQRRQPGCHVTTHSLDDEKDVDIAVSAPRPVESMITDRIVEQNGFDAKKSEAAASQLSGYRRRCESQKETRTAMVRKYRPPITEKGWREAEAQDGSGDPAYLPKRQEDPGDAGMRYLVEPIGKTVAKGELETRSSAVTDAANHLIQNYVLVEHETSSKNKKSEILVGATEEESLEPSSEGNAQAVDDINRVPWYQLQRDISIQEFPLLVRPEASTGMESIPGAYPQGSVTRLLRAPLTTDDGQPFENEGASEKSFLDEAGSLVVANPVVAEDLSANLPHAQEWPQLGHKELRSRSALCCGWRWKVLLFFACLIVVTILPVAVKISLQEGSSEESNLRGTKGLQGIQPGQSPEDYLVSLLPEHTLNELEDAKSPQSKAFEWLLGDSEYLSGSYPAWRVIQRYALATFYYSTGGDSKAGWIRSDNWMSYDHHECTWYMTDPEDVDSHAYFANPDLDQSICSGERLQNLALVSNQLKGTLAPELYLLTDLKAMSFRSNKLSGSLSPHLASVANLVFLDVMNNEIRGSIPTELGLLHKMDGLFFINNQISGSIPTQLGELTSLRFLLADSNALTGPIPSQLGAIPEILNLEAQMNFLTGTFPTQLAAILQMANLWGNTLTGSIPSEFGSNQNMLLLALGDSPLTGTLPTQLGAMQALGNLCIARTQLDGTVPTELGNLSNLQGLQLASNRFHGTMPAELAQLSSLWGLGLSNNNITGTIPTALGQMKDLLGVQLDNNKFSGFIPSQFGSLPNLEALDLSGNLVSGTIPSELGQATSIQGMRLSRNKLTGTIPSSFGLLFHKGFSLIETYYSHFDHLPDLFLSGIPTGELLLDNNQLDGPIPSELGLMKNLHSFCANTNFLTGRIPSQLGLLSKLEKFVVNTNALGGSVIP